MKNFKNNKEKIAEIVKDMLIESHEAMLKKINKVLNSGCIDVESWDEEKSPMILPKSIVIALLQNEGKEYYPPSGSSFEKEMKKEIKNIFYFI